MQSISTVGGRSAGNKYVSTGIRAAVVAAMASAGMFSASAHAIQTDFSVDYRATGFYVDSDSFDNDQEGIKDSDSGFAHYLRLGADFKHEETGVSVITRIELAGDRWQGDSRDYQTTADQAFNTDNNGDNVRIDLAFIQVPLGKTLLRVGRQESNWNNCFLACDDRRDRIFVARRFGPVSTFIGYDRRQDNVEFSTVDDGDQFFPGFVAPIFNTGFNLGFLYLYFNDSYDGNLTEYPFLATNGAPYVVNDATAFSPYIDGSVGPVTIQFGGNYFSAGDVENNATPEDGDFFADGSWAQYFRIGTELGMFNVRAQYIGAQDGGLISPGFDTYSSLINSSPESTANPTSVYTMGRFLGRKGFDESLYIGNVTAQLTDKLSIGGSVGYLELDFDDTVNGVGGEDGADSDGSMVYDVEIAYQYNPVFRTWVTAGILERNEVGALRGNSLIGQIPNGGTFGDGDVFAGSVNLGVEF